MAASWFRSCAALALCLLGCLATCSTCRAIEIIVPWYAYPSHFDTAIYQWDELATSASQLEFTAIINPADGPGDGPNSDYRFGLDQLRAAGIHLLGYVTTRLPNVPLRPIADVKLDIDRWVELYAEYEIGGIMFDGTSVAEADTAYYEELYRYVHSKPNFTRVVLNPGTAPAESYFSRTTADTIFSYENTYADWTVAKTPSYMSAYAPARFGALVYGATSVTAMRVAVSLARNRGFGVVYVTHDLLPNPWDSLPSYWNDELGYIRSVSVPALDRRSHWLLACALLLLAAAFTTKGSRAASRTR